MPALGRRSHRIVIAGASSLLGAELRSLLEESRFAAADLRLVDEEIVAGLLTETAGEPAVIQRVEEDSFERAQTVFFTGSKGFTRANLEAARRAGAKILDLSGETAGVSGTVEWFPKLDWLLGRNFAKEATVYGLPSAAATAAASLALALARLGSRHLMVACFQPASEAGRAGIEELESQTGQLLSFQGVGQPVFDAQVAFNMLDRFGAKSAHQLSAVRERVRTEVKACLAGRAAMPALQILHAPVFYGMAFAACAALKDPVTAEQITHECEQAGFSVTREGDPEPSNVSVAGEKMIRLAKPERDPGAPESWWFWGAADNVHLPAANAVKLAEMLA